MIPAKRKTDEGAVGGPVEVQRRSPDKDEDYGVLDAVVDDLMAVLELSPEKKPRLKAALESLCDHIQSQDIKQDQEMGD
jgi:hypothetical protein